MNLLKWIYYNILNRYSIGRNSSIRTEYDDSYFDYLELYREYYTKPRTVKIVGENGKKEKAQRRSRVSARRRKQNAQKFKQKSTKTVKKVK